MLLLTLVTDVLDWEEQTEGHVLEDVEERNDAEVGILRVADAHAELVRNVPHRQVALIRGLKADTMRMLPEGRVFPNEGVFWARIRIPTGAL